MLLCRDRFLTKVYKVPLVYENVAHEIVLGFTLNNLNCLNNICVAQNAMQRFHFVDKEQKSHLKRKLDAFLYKIRSIYND